MDSLALQPQRTLADHPPPILDPTWEVIEGLFSEQKTSEEAIKREALRKMAEMKRKLCEKRQKENQRKNHK